MDAGSTRLGRDLVIVRDSSCAMRPCLFFGKSASGDKLLKQAVLVSELKAEQQHHFFLMAFQYARPEIAKLLFDVVDCLTFGG